VRVFRQKNHGEPGEVDFIYTFGTPGTGSPGLKNMRGPSPCFNGLRTWRTRDGYNDAGAVATSPIGYVHGAMDTESIPLDKSEPVATLCDDATGNNTITEPTTWPRWSLHHVDDYTSHVKMLRNKDDNWGYNISAIAANDSYFLDPFLVSKTLVGTGWGHAGFARFPGGVVLGGGMQVAHLLQKESNLECVITFQGTASVEGWLENMETKAVPFCGLTLEGEHCLGPGACKTEKPRGSFVHYGFKWRLERITQDATWRNYVQPHLQHCSSVSVVGHSLGGAAAELFAACASNAPKEGEYGYDDYESIGWNKGNVRRLRYIRDEREV